MKPDYPLHSELPGAEPDPSLYSEDLAPVSPAKRTWSTWNYAALWISMSLCIPTYMLASSLIGGGMSWWAAILTIFFCDTIFPVSLILHSQCRGQNWLSFSLFF